MLSGLITCRKHNSLEDKKTQIGAANDELLGSFCQGSDDSVCCSGAITHQGSHMDDAACVGGRKAADTRASQDTRTAHVQETSEDLATGLGYSSLSK